MTERILFLAGRLAERRRARVVAGGAPAGVGTVRRRAGGAVLPRAAGAARSAP